jgi:hypothetical protein
MPTELCALALKYRSDKCPEILHGYTPYYHSLFKNNREEVRKVLEIGIGTPSTMQVDGYKAGASLFMWKDYFPKAMIYGVDILDEAMVNEFRIQSYKCDQSKREELIELAKKLGGNFDLIIDDGSHNPKDQMLTALVLIPLLKPGGYYVIEDARAAEDLADFLANQGYSSQIFIPEKPVSVHDKLIWTKRLIW